MDREKYITRFDIVTKPMMLEFMFKHKIFNAQDVIALGVENRTDKRKTPEGRARKIVKFLAYLIGMGFLRAKPDSNVLEVDESFIPRDQREPVKIVEPKKTKKVKKRRT